MNRLSCHRHSCTEPLSLPFALLLLRAKQSSGRRIATAEGSLAMTGRRRTSAEVSG